ncbi:DEAD/DEAH box helicase [Mesorhizobium sp. ASY16-5R]|uniref:DEAD/DEAH box helicase n=1 Tax=Mesorhizobium sp. ASY16-5R TaxID=3445772 RepID=UPI003FA07D6B
MTTFDGIVPALAHALAARGYLELTPVQQAVTGPDLEERDALVSAQTGSGKTVAFGIAIARTLLGDAERFGPAGAPLALAIAPTRELALQVMRELEWLYAETGATVASCVGGMDMRTERRVLERGAHIVVGTPGRLRDHIMRNSLDMSALRAVVLDEADEMLDLGFREDLEFILNAAPPERRTLMFSATVPRAIAALAASYQRDALRVSVQSAEKQHADIDYRALTVAGHDRENAIINVLRYYEAASALVFCSTRAAVNHMTARFNNRGFSVVALSGELSQSERTHALQAMRDGRARVCIATDVAARGIDLPNLELVVHADMPTNPDTLLHRSGRTGRAGRKGISVLIVPYSARRRIERLLQNASVKAFWTTPPTIEDVNKRDDERLLANPLLAGPVAAEEKALVRQLLEQNSPEQIAAAFVRVLRAGRSAPEELAESQPPERERPERGERQAAKPAREREFGPSVWFSVSVGRKQNAEPRWLLPMLCRRGNITKGDIGAIRMQQAETFVQLTAASADGFLAALGPERVLENGIRATRLEGAPDMGEAPQRAYSKRKDFAAADAGKPERPKFRDRKGDKSVDKAPWAGKKAGKPGFDKAKKRKKP